MSNDVAKPNAATAKRHPEKKWGPFNGGVGVALWLNKVETALGVRYFRSLTLQARRFRHPKTGLWTDAKSLRPTDLPALILAMEDAQRFMASTPLPGPAAADDEDELAEGELPNDPPLEEPDFTPPPPSSPRPESDIPF